MFDLKEKMRVMHCSGVEGPSLYINNFRVCGPKPWGGGSVVKEWKDAETGDILRALGNNYLQAVNSHEALVEALRNLERANDKLCVLRTQEQYDSMISSGQEDALIRLGEARLQARAALKKAGVEG